MTERFTEARERLHAASQAHDAALSAALDRISHEARAGVEQATASERRELAAATAELARLVVALADAAAHWRDEARKHEKRSKVARADVVYLHAELDEQRRSTGPEAA